MAKETAKEVIATDRAPAAVGPYSQGVKVSGARAFIYTAGQIPLDPATGKMVEGGIEEQARRALQNLQAVLEEAGASLADVVKTTVFLADMGDFKAVNGVYAGFFGDAPPARSAIGVAALPLGARIEIEAVAAIM